MFKGRKFDIRAFMVVLCSKPWFVLAHTGYARVCLPEFKMKNFGKKQVQESTGKLTPTTQRMIHETSVSVQRKHPDFLERKQETTITLDKLKAQLIEEGKTTDLHFKERVTDRMLEAMRLVFLQVKDRLDARYGCFEIFGVDFLVSEEEDDLCPKLMEITSCPSL